LAISKAIKSINANYKDGENGFETEIFQMFGTNDFKGRYYCLLEKEKLLYWRIKKLYKKNTADSLLLKL
jgi:enoyl-CoA hydratase